MIRFCDKEVCCISEAELDRQILMAYFFDGNRREPVCVLDESGKFVGIITYDLLLGKNLNDAIRKDCLILDDNIWKNGRKMFLQYEKNFGGEILIPVLNEERYLLCFAWQDEEANRELRMLDELMECGDAAGFAELYPEYDCVTVRGCNELAYSFVQYLEKAGILVNVTGVNWSSLELGKKHAQEWKEEEAADYRKYTVHGEGVSEKKINIEERSSVSAEFECIDRIYEENIKKGMIKDTKEDPAGVIHKLRGKKIGILNMAQASLNAYDFLLKNGIDICCFVSDRLQDHGQELFGKKVLKISHAMTEMEDMVFLDAENKYSSWGFGQADMCHYFGYKRNEKFFMFRDYAELPWNGLYHIMRHRLSSSDGKMILAGDYHLCLWLNQMLAARDEHMRGRIAYCDILNEHEQCDGRMPWINSHEVQKQDFCLLALPNFNCNFEDNKKCLKMAKAEYKKRFWEQNITDVSEYSVDQMILAKWPNMKNSKKWQVGGVLLGSIDSSCGNVFFREILDGHPQIMMIDYCYLNDNLISICFRLAKEKRENILPLLWKLYDEKIFYGFQQDEIWDASGKQAFHQNMQKLLTEQESFTPGELFVIIHVAYARMLGQKVDHISDMFIYWEPHFVAREMEEEYTAWLNNLTSKGTIVSVVRNACIQAGSVLKSWKSQNLFTVMRFLPFAMSRRDPWNIKNYLGWNRISIKFEDLKTEPKKIMEDLCDKTGLQWSDRLLETSYRGAPDCDGFRLNPVYNAYDELISSFDRFRISLICGAWQKDYGYPYARSLDFSRSELQKIFDKPFWFEEDASLDNEDVRKNYRKFRRKILRINLWKNRRKEIMGK